MFHPCCTGCAWKMLDFYYECFDHESMAVVSLKFSVKGLSRVKSCRFLTLLPVLKNMFERIVDYEDKEVRRRKSLSKTEWVH